MNKEVQHRHLSASDRFALQKWVEENQEDCLLTTIPGIVLRVQRELNIDVTYCNVRNALRMFGIRKKAVVSAEPKEAPTVAASDTTDLEHRVNLLTSIVIQLASDLGIEKEVAGFAALKQSLPVTCPGQVGNC